MTDESAAVLAQASYLVGDRVNEPSERSFVQDAMTTLASAVVGDDPDEPLDSPVRPAATPP